MQIDARTVFLISRPRFWLYLAGPYLVGYAFGVTELSQFLSAHFWLYFGYFLIPANIFLYGINDVFDMDTDQLNARKQDYEHALQATQKNALLGVLVLCTLITCVAALLTLNVTSAALLFLLAALSYGYSAPPFRWKAKPLIDFSSNILYVVPGLFGYHLLTQTLPSLEVILVLGLWTAAMHLFSAIPDIQADAQSRLQTTAVVLGEKKALVLCAVLWLLCAAGATILLSSATTLFLGIYALIPLLCLLVGWSVAKVYPLFPFLNAFVGCVLFWAVLLSRLS